jgi:PAS domain S-box-containing protein
MYDAVGDGVFVHPMQTRGFGRFIDVNETACRRYGYTREEFLNLSVGDITPDEETAIYSSVEWRRKVAEKGRIIFEATQITKSGNVSRCKSIPWSLK